MLVQLKVPQLGESISSVEVGAWRKAVGEAVSRDEAVVEIESDKATVELSAPEAGVLSSIIKRTGEVAAPGDVVGEIDTAEAAAPEPVEAEPAPVATPVPVRAAAAPRDMPVAARPLASSVPSPEAVTGAGVPEPAARRPAPTRSAAEAVSAPPSRGERVAPMSLMRRTIAARMLEAQQAAALLTTFNEIDMVEVMAVRREFGESFQQRHGVKLGLMSFFVAAAVAALREIPEVNASVRGEEIVYHDYFDIGIAIGSGKGLVVPVLRNAERMSFAEIERTLVDLATRARSGKLTLEELRGGTFTISNGGIYGSLLSTPIVNPPQSAILGLHAIQDRPVARDGQVVIRPMMNVALTYDHRLIDGREAVTFLLNVKRRVEHPSALVLDG